MGVAAGDYMYDVVVKKFTFAISSADEFLLLWPNGWMHQDATWYGGIGLGPGDFVFDVDPATPRKTGIPIPPNFWPMSIVDKRLDGSRCHLVRR